MALEAGSPGQNAPARQATSAALPNQSPLRFELAPQIIGGLTRQAVQFFGGQSPEGRPTNDATVSRWNRSAPPIRSARSSFRWHNLKTKAVQTPRRAAISRTVMTRA